MPSSSLGTSLIRSITAMSPELTRLHGGSLPNIARPRDVIRRIVRSAYRPRKIEPTSQWAAKHRKLTSEDSSSPGEWRNEKTPWLVDVMDDMSDGSPVWKQTLVSGAQNGKTSAGLNVIAAWMAQSPAPTMIVLPNGTIAKEFGEQRLGPLIRTTKQLRKTLIKDLQRYKVFLGGAIFMASAESGNDLRSKPIKNLYMDEIDGMPHEIKGEGSPISLAINRTNTFKAKRKIFLTSTPTEETTSAIWKEYLAGTMELFFVPCPHCHQEIVFEIEGLKWDRENLSRIEETVHYECTECAKPIYEHQKTAMTRNGQWKPTRKDLENVQEGVVSRRINSLYNPPDWISWVDIAYEFEASYRSPSKWRDFLNTKLALPVREATEKVDWESVYHRGTIGEMPYTMLPNGCTIVPKGVLFLTGGIDVGSNHIEVGVWGWGRNRHRWLIDHYRIDGNTQLQSTWDDLSLHVRHMYTNYQGVEMQVRPYLIDTSYIPEKVKPWIRTQNQLIVMGVDPMADKPNPVRIDTQADPTPHGGQKKSTVGGLKMIFLDVSYFKAELMGALSIPEPEAHTHAPMDWVHMPLHGGSFTKEIAQQLVSEQKVIHRDKNGSIRKITWDRIDGRRAEVLDDHNYARGGARLRGWDRGVDAYFDRLEAELNEAATAIREAAAAEARGAPVVTPPKTTVGVILPKSKAPSIVVSAGSHAQQSTNSRVTITGSDTPRRIVPLPKMPTPAGDY